MVNINVAKLRNDLDANSELRKVLKLIQVNCLVIFINWIICF